MNQLAINFAARELRDAGMAQTLEAEHEEWLAQALGALQAFAILPGHGEFKMEDFRAFYARQRLPMPHDPHCWGAITTKAVKAGIIRWTGKYAQSISPKTHAHPVKVWTRA